MNTDLEPLPGPPVLREIRRLTAEEKRVAQARIQRMGLNRAQARAAVKELRGVREQEQKDEAPASGLAGAPS